MQKHEKLEYTLPKKMIIILFVYYLLILVGGCILSIHIGCSLATPIDQSILLRKAFIISLSVSGMLCSVQYIKRLYKACITERIDSQSNAYKKWGILCISFHVRFFAFAFSVIAVFAMLSGLFIVTGCLDYILNEKFLYLCVISSAIIGFSIGKVLDKFGSISTERIESLK